ncbi:ATP-binding protein [Streptomyces abikoensis]|uniref:ATP-binding protein n=1 Tax=Streptomyces abikoensis TaxID=97398 RepID=UPI00340AD5C7
MSSTVLNDPRTAPYYNPHTFYELAAPATATTARLARQFVRGTLQATNHPALIEDACVCVSDAVANVVQHARVSALSVEVTVRPYRVVVAVRDDDPVRRPYGRLAAKPGDERGRGFVLMNKLSHAFGVNLVWDGLHVIGKRVWFELRER